jgi:hypothetical protein
MQFAEEWSCRRLKATAAAGSKGSLCSAAFLAFSHQFRGHQHPALSSNTHASHALQQQMQQAREHAQSDFAQCTTTLSTQQDLKTA